MQCWKTDGPPSSPWGGRRAIGPERWLGDVRRTAFKTGGGLPTFEGRPQSTEWEKQVAAGQGQAKAN